jgi:hypothetical protein
VKYVIWFQIKLMPTVGHVACLSKKGESPVQLYSALQYVRKYFRTASLIL